MNMSFVNVVLPEMKLRVDQLDGAVIQFHVIASARSIRARWRGGMLHVTVPPGQRVRDAVERLIDMRERILAARPALSFYDGQHIEMDGFTVDIRRQSLVPDKITLTGSTFEPVVSVGSNLDFDDAEVTALVSRMMCIVAKTVAPKLLIPRAVEIAARVGATPRRWSISSGHKTLGTCKASGEIALSAVVMFLTPELRDYIICHELAHLSEMNHSPRFHALCDRYCGGRERELIKKLKHYQWPILRL